MKSALLAFAFGISLFALCRAALSTESEQTAYSLWFAVLVVVLLHAASGFLAIGGSLAKASRRPRDVATCAVASLAATAVSLSGAAFLAWCLPVVVEPTLAASAIGLTLLLSVVVTVCTSSRVWLRQRLLPRAGGE